MKRHDTTPTLGISARLLIGAGIAASLFLIGIPLITIFSAAFKEGWQVYWKNISQPDTLAAIRLTVFAALVSVLVNTVFGVIAAWLLAHFRFPGRKLLLSLIELPLSMPSIVAGTAYLFIYGAQGWLGPWLMEHHLKIMFAVPGIILITVFVTCPFVIREILPVMESQGQDEEDAAHTLGANGWQILLRITLPKIRWGLFYGIMLCNARAFGEFGAVSVVSGAIRGETSTLTLQVDQLYHDYNSTGAFASATLLALITIVTLMIKLSIEHSSTAKSSDSITSSSMAAES
ncbi:MAG: sulfate ABC transporter permease subunit CysW [Verrucomicrobiales bacterium]|jgi:sulfate transport system permease protein|nr:sulfate ABC transporter permease subunit CysW [Verrucomicrobiales bacterium]